MIRYISKKRNYYIRLFIAGLKNWAIQLSKKIRGNPIRNISFLLLSLLLMYYIGQVLYNKFGVFPLLGYLFWSLYGMKKLIDKPIRTFIWGFGFWLSAIAIGLAFRNFVSDKGGLNVVLSLTSIMTIALIVLIYLQARKLKRY